MPRRGRPRKNHSLYSVKDLIEYTSDSEQDSYLVRHNDFYEVGNERERSPLRAIILRFIGQAYPNEMTLQHPYSPSSKY